MQARTHLVEIILERDFQIDILEQQVARILAGTEVLQGLECGELFGRLFVAETAAANHFVVEHHLCHEGRLAVL